MSIGVAGLTGVAPAAYADVPNTVSLYLQPLTGCTISFIGNLPCTGVAGPLTAANAAPATNAQITQHTGYALCWTTAAGTTTPTGVDCTEGAASATAPAGTRVDTSALAFSGTQDAGCGLSRSVNGNQALMYVADTSPCTITITTPTVPGFTATTTSFTFPVGLPRTPLLLGPSVAASGSGRVGQRAPLQSIDCRYQVETLGNFKYGCEGVTLNWAVTSGAKACRIIVNRNTESEALGSVSVRFIRPGTCTVQGSYPAVSGSSDAYATPTYTYTVRAKQHR